MISFEDFNKVQLRVGEITEAKKIDKSDKLLLLKVSLGEKTVQIVAGIGRQYTPEQLQGEKIAVLANLKPKSLMGFVSEGMLLAGHNEKGEPVLLKLEKSALNGSAIG